MEIRIGKRPRSPEILHWMQNNNETDKSMKKRILNTYFISTMHFVMTGQPNVIVIIRLDLIGILAVFGHIVLGYPDHIYLESGLQWDR